MQSNAPPLEPETPIALMLLTRLCGPLVLLFCALQAWWPLRALSQSDLDAVRAEIGREGITAPETEKWVTISGDGTPLSPSEVAGSRLLIHEATFLSPDDYDAEEAGEDYGHVHSTVAQALEVAHEAEVEAVALYHISTRYTDAEIRDAVRAEAQRLNLSARVWVALPRRVHWNLLKEKPVW